MALVALLYRPSSADECCDKNGSKEKEAQKETHECTQEKAQKPTQKPEEECCDDHKGEDHGDFCREHNVAESECGICSPGLVPQLDIGKGLKIRMGSLHSADKAGVEITSPVLRAPMTGSQLQGKITYNYYRLAHITSLTPGIIGKVRVKNGDVVRKGQVLVEVRSNTIVAAQEDYLNALTNERVKKSNYLREKKMRDKQISSALEYEQALAQYREAQQKRLSSRQLLINLGLSESRLIELETNRTPSPLLPVTAPFNGTIVAHHAVRGEVVDTHMKLLTLTDLANFWLEISIPERDLAQVCTGSILKVLPDALPHLNLESRLTWISSEIHPQTRTLQGRALLDNTDGVLKHGMYARVFLQPGRTEQVLTVPAKSLHYFSTHPFLFVKLEADLFEVRRVVTGSVQAQDVEILKGLVGNESIVAERSFILKSELLKSRLGAGCVDH